MKDPDEETEQIESVMQALTNPDISELDVSEAWSVVEELAEQGDVTFW